MPPPDMEAVPLSAIAPKLQTGDLVLFSGATSSGAIIKFFDRAQFSHIAIVSLGSEHKVYHVSVFAPVQVIRTEYSARPLIWEASTNKAGNPTLL